MHMIVRRALLRVAAITALVVAAAGLGVAAPAQAATKPIGLSIDGVTYADHLPASIYAGATIVPGTTVTRTFWVKNRGTTAGNLALAVQDIAGGDASMIAALSLKATAGAHTGSDVPFSSVNPCTSLLSAMLMQPGDTMRVDVVLKLASSLNQRTSQASAGAFRLRVVLTSTAVPAPDGCAPATPPGGGTAAPTPSGEIDTETISGAADGSALPTLADGPLSGLGGTGLGAGYRTIEPNTGRFFQEFDVAWWLVAVALGGIFAWYRRRNDNLEEAH